MFSQTFVAAAIPWDLLSRVAENCWFIMAIYKPMLKLVLAVLVLAVCLNSVVKKDLLVLSGQHGLQASVAIRAALNIRI